MNYYINVKLNFNHLLTLLRVPLNSAIPAGCPGSSLGSRSSSEPEEFQLWLSDISLSFFFNDMKSDCKLYNTIWKQHTTLRWVGFLKWQYQNNTSNRSRRYHHVVIIIIIVDIKQLLSSRAPCKGRLSSAWKVAPHFVVKSTFVNVSRGWGWSCQLHCSSAPLFFSPKEMAGRGKR